MGFKKHAPGGCCCEVAESVYVLREDYLHLYDENDTLLWTDTLSESVNKVGCGATADGDFLAAGPDSGDSFGDAYQWELDGTLHQEDVDAHIDGGLDTDYDRYVGISVSACHDGFLYIWREIDDANFTDQKYYWQRLVRGSWQGSKASLGTYAFGFPDVFTGYDSGTTDASGNVAIGYIDSGAGKLYYNGSTTTLTASGVIGVFVRPLYDDSILVTELLASTRKRRRLDSGTEVTSGSWPVSRNDFTDDRPLGFGYWAHSRIMNYDGSEKKNLTVAGKAADNSSNNELFMDELASFDVPNNEIDIDYYTMAGGSSTPTVRSLPGHGTHVVSGSEATPVITSVYSYPVDP